MKNRQDCRYSRKGYRQGGDPRRNARPGPGWKQTGHHFSLGRIWLILWNVPSRRPDVIRPNEPGRRRL